jgi:hypothetical protein
MNMFVFPDIGSGGQDQASYFESALFTRVVASFFEKPLIRTHRVYRARMSSSSGLMSGSNID